jgi:hypothetical protein
MTCEMAGCGESFSKPVWGKDAVTNKSVYLCPYCRGAVRKPSEMRSSK